MGNKNKFINPYNFIPLSSKCTRHKSEDKKNYTGYIQCELETYTPLIMIDPSICKLKKEHKVYSQTYMIDNIPFIPGSELRGMIRSKFETLTNSCMSSSNPNLPFYGRYNGNMRRPGLLDFSNPKEIKLYECKMYKVFGNIQGKVSGDKIKFNINEKKQIEINENGSYEGYLKIGEEFREKNAIHIFVCSKLIGNIDNADNFREMYNEIHEIYFNNLKKRNHKSYTESLYRPVWFEKRSKDNYVYFSFGQNGQTKYQRHFKDLIEPSYLPCDDINQLCEACTLFGTVNKDKNIASSSKIRVGDARAVLISDTDKYFIDEGVITLSELASPKYTNPEFYLIQYKKNGVANLKPKLQWNVDFQSRFNMNKAQMIPFEDGQVKIRGRKEYWHFKPKLSDFPKLNDPHNKQKKKRNVSVQPIKENIKYEFKVYFNDITEEQLEHLNMAICLENDSRFMHKLGLGKPLGFGSVKVRTKEIKCREIEYKDGKLKYIMKPYYPKFSKIKECFSSLDKTQYKAIEKMYNFDYLTDRVKIDYPRNYPKNHPKGNIYEWFRDNKKYKKILPFSDKEYDALIQHGFKEIGGKGKK